MLERITTHDYASMQASQSGEIDLNAGFILNGVSVLPRQSVVLRDQERVKLEPKVMAVLLELTRQQGEVVTRSDFAETVWRGRIVSDEALSRHVSMLRTALGDDAREPRFIQTIPTIGYRLVADVIYMDTDKPRRHKRFIAGGTVLAAIAIATWFFFVSTQPPSLPQTTIAVLPFENLSDTIDAEYFSDGIAEEVMGSLARSEELFVVARTSSFAFRDRDEDVRFIGKTLGAGSILEGSVRKYGDTIKVSVRLVNANDGLQLWSESFEEKLKDVFVVQNQISDAIVERLVGTLTPDARRGLRDTVNLEAYQLFLRANHQIHRRGPTAMTKSIELFQNAIALDPKFARAYVGLAQAHALAPTYLDELEEPYLVSASEALARAEALGYMSARLLLTKAYVYFREWRWSDAHKYFAQALDEAPNDSDIQQQYSQFLGNVGYIHESLERAQDGVQSDPLSGLAHQRLAVVYLYIDSLQKAREHFQMADEMGMGELATPEAYIMLLARLGQFDEVATRLRALQKQRGLADDWVTPVMIAVRQEGGIENALNTLYAAYRNRVIGSRLYLGILYFIGDEDGYFDGLNLLIDEHAAIDTEILFTPIAETLRQSPRFADAMGRMGITGYWQERGRPLE